jgi:hypothetical protein
MADADQKTGKPVAATTRYAYQDVDDRYVVSFIRSHDLPTDRMVESIQSVRRIAAKLMHFDGAHLRFVGDFQISRYRGGELVETYKGRGDLGTHVLGHAR